MALTYSSEIKISSSKTWWNPHETTYNFLVMTNLWLYHFLPCFFSRKPFQNSLFHNFISLILQLENIRTIWVLKTTQDFLHYSSWHQYLIYHLLHETGPSSWCLPITSSICTTTFPRPYRFTHYFDSNVPNLPGKLTRLYNFSLIRPTSESDSKYP